MENNIRTFNQGFELKKRKLLTNFNYSWKIVILCTYSETHFFDIGAFVKSWRVSPVNRRIDSCSVRRFAKQAFLPK